MYIHQRKRIRFKSAGNHAKSGRLLRMTEPKGRRKSGQSMRDDVCLYAEMPQTRRQIINREIDR